MTQSQLEAEFEFHLKALKIKKPEREYTFASPRRWRFDFAWVDEKIAVEIEGGIWTGGRHVRGKGFENDCEKGNQAQLMGWAVYRFTPSHIARGDAVEIIRKALKTRHEEAISLVYKLSLLTTKKKRKKKRKKKGE